MNNKNESILAASDLDLSFGRNGLVELPDPTSPERLLALSAIAVDPAQRIYVGAYGDLTAATASSYIARLLADGTLDKSFGSEGYVLLPRGDFKQHEGVVPDSFVFHESGKEITCFGSVVGWPEGNWYSFYSAAVRITSEGVIDESFGEGGLAVYWTPSLEDKKSGKDSIDPGQNETREALPSLRNDAQGVEAFKAAGNARLVDGKILFLAKGLFSAKVSYLARINLDGSLDPTFGTDGLIMVTDPAADSEPAVDCWGFDIDRRGGIVVVGQIPVSASGIVCRYGSSGDRDQEFGDAGVVRFLPGDGYNLFYPRSVKALDDGKLILQVAAFPSEAGSPAPQFPAIVKLLRNGERDPAFNNGEPALIDDLRPSLYAVSTVALDTAGRIVVSGFRMGDGLYTAGCLSRVVPAGLPDDGFGSGGTRVYEELQPYFSGIAIQSRVNILVRMSGNGPDRIGRFIG